MSVADASLTSVRYALESTFGTPPYGAYKEVRMVSEDLGQDVDTTASDEIVSDRTTPDNIQIGAGASGSLTAELTGGSVASGVTWDDMWLGSLAATGFTTLQATLPGVLTGTITVGGTGDQVTLLLSSGTWNPAFAAGEFLVFAGFTGARAVLNTVFRLVSGAGTNTLTLDSGPASPGGTEPSAALVSVVQCRGITPGSVFRSFSFERKYNLSSQYAVNSGLVPSGFDWELRPKRPLRTTFHFIGDSEASFGATHALTNEVNTITAASTPATAGNFTLTVNGQTTANIAFNATAAAVQAALELLSSVGVGNVTCVATTGANLGVANAVVTITYGGTLGGQNLTTSATMAGLTGNPHVFAVSTEGGADALIPAVTAQKSFSSTNDVKMWAFNKDGHSFAINSMTLQFRNGAYTQDEQGGVLGPVGIGFGSFGLTGSMEFYYSSKTVMDWAAAFTDTEWAFAASNGSGSTVGIYVPRLNFKNPRRSTPGKDQPIKGTVDFQAAKGSAPYLCKLFVL